MQTETQETTPAAADLAQANGLDITKIDGSGQNGRVLVKDVQSAIKAPESEAAESTETTKESQEATAATAENKGHEISVSAEEPALPVGDRVVLAMIERRTGLPIRQSMKLFGSDPYFLTDSVVPVVAIRVRKQQRSGGREVFNPVLPQEVFEELFGGSKSEKVAQSEDYYHRIGIYSFDGTAQDRLRFSRGLDDEFGRNELERAIRHWTMSLLGNPNIAPGVFGLNSDLPGNSVMPENPADLHKAVERMFSKPKSINRALGVPPMSTIGMDRNTRDDDHFGQAFFNLADDYLHRSGSLTDGFEDYKVYGLFTASDQHMVESKGQKVKEEFQRIFTELNAQGASVPTANFRDMILGKFLSGVQRFTPTTMHAIREFLRTADQMHARGASEAELALESARASEVLYEVSGQHIVNVLEPKFINDACRLAGRRLNGAIDTKSLQALAVHTSEGGTVVQDKRFSLAHCRDIVAGKHPMQKKLSKAAKMVAEHARSWHMGSLQDCTSAMSGLKAYFCSRTCSRDAVMTFMLPMHLSTMTDEVRDMEVRPSFFLIQGAPVQVLNKSFGAHIPSSLDGFFSKR